MDARGTRTPVRSRTATPPRAGSAGRFWLRLRELTDNQVRLWERALADLRPWDQEELEQKGPLRRHGTRLEGATVGADALAAPVHRGAHQ